MIWGCRRCLYVVYIGGAIVVVGYCVVLVVITRLVFVFVSVLLFTVVMAGC